MGWRPDSLKERATVQPIGWDTPMGWGAPKSGGGRGALAKLTEEQMGQDQGAVARLVPDGSVEGRTPSPVPVQMISGRGPVARGRETAWPSGART